MPEPEPPLKIVPSSTYQLRIESIVSSTERMKQADGLLGHALDADVEPHRRVERRLLGDDQVLELGAEGLGLARRRRSSRPRMPQAVMVSTTRSATCLQRRLPLGRAERAPEVLLGDDVGGVERPADGELDAELLEGDRAVAVVGDAGVAPLPRRPRRRGATPSVVKWRRMPMPVCSGARANGGLLV